LVIERIISAQKKELEMEIAGLKDEARAVGLSLPASTTKTP
jgi:hypothetical protein